MIWIINNQLGRRNLSDFQKIELAQKKKEILAGKGKEKRKQNLKRGDKKPEISTVDTSGKTQKQIAKELGMSTGKVLSLNDKGTHDTRKEIAFLL